MLSLVYAAEAGAFEAAQKNADARIEAYQNAVTQGDPALIRETALAVQKDPLAVQRVNQNMPPEFKQRISSDVTAVREQAKAQIRKQAAEHYGVHENRIDFLEASNPSKDSKLGQDWDVTVRVDGMAVPLDVAAPIVQQSFYEAAKGRPAPSLEEAAHFAHEQSVEPINQSSAEAYGSGGRKEVMDPETGEKKIITEGEDIITGDKSQPMRDSEHFGHVMEHKSDLAKNRAAEKRAAGQDTEAVGWDMEQARQYSKQEAKQIQTRVEAAGGEIPEHVQKGNAILDEVAAGNISPEEGRKQLAEMGETPESIVKKGTGLVEAADKLGTTPAEKIARAKSGQAPQDVFVDNVKEKMALKKLEREAAALKEGPRANLLDGEGKSSSAHLEETLPDTRAEQVRDRASRTAAAEGLDAPKSLLGGGKSSVAVPDSDIRAKAEGVTDAVDWTGWAVEAYQKEKQAAAEEGRGFNPLNVGVNAFKGLAAGNAYEISKKHSQAAVAEARAKGESPWWTIPGTMLAAAGEFASKTLNGVKDQHEQYQKEEMEKEIARAQKAGEAANAWRAKIPALMRIMGDVAQVNRFADWWVYGKEAEASARAAAEMQKKMKARAKAAVEAGLTGFGDLERGIKAALEKSNGEITEEVLALQKEYHERMASVQGMRDHLFAKGYVNLQDPEWIAINQSANLLDSNIVETVREELKPVFEDKVHADILREGIRTCKVTEVESHLEQIQNLETKAALAAEIQALRGRVNEFNQKLQQVNDLEASGKLVEARAQLAPLIAQVPCEDRSAPFAGRLRDLNRRIHIEERTAACKNIPGAEAGINQVTGEVSCVCPDRHIFDAKLNMCVLDRARMDRELEALKNPPPYEPDPSYDSSYLPAVPSYEEEQNQFAMQNQMFNALQARQQASAGNTGGLNVNQMYANMASSGSQWSDPTNTASGSAYRPAGYTTHSSGGQPAGFSNYNAAPAAPSYTSGPGQGEFSAGPGRNQDWCTTGRDAAGNCAGVDFGKTYS